MYYAFMTPLALILLNNLVIFGMVLRQLLKVGQEATNSRFITLLLQTL